MSPDSAEVEPAWSPDGKQIAYATKPKTGSSYEIDLMDVATRHVRHLTKNTPKELSNEQPYFLARRQVHRLHAGRTPPAKMPTSSCSIWPVVKAPI